MKRLILICSSFLLMSFIVFSASYFDATQLEYDSFYHSGETIADPGGVYTFYILGQEKEPEQIFDALEIVLNEYNANLYSMMLSQDDGATTKLVFCSHPKMFDNLVLENGRFFTKEENRSDLFISTDKTDDPRQIGILSKFDKKYVIRTIYSEIGNDVFRREFTLVLPDSQLFSDFLQTVRLFGLDISETGGTKVSMSSQQSFYSMVKWITVCVELVILIMIISFSVVNSYKRIGTEKLMGYSIFTIWKRRVPAILVSELVIVLVGFIVAYYLLFNTWSVLTERFFIEQAEIFAGISVLTALSTIIPFIYVKKIKLTDVLKNRKSTTLAIGLNSTVKSILLIVIIIAASSIYTQMKMVETRYSISYSNWEETRNYALIRYVVVNNGLYDPFSEDKTEAFKAAYKDFNQNGAIYADFEAYEIHEDFLQKEINKTAIVNKNYLKANPVYDVYGQAFELNDNDKDYIILVPEKFKRNEQEIITLHKANADSEQNIKIIWIKNEQAFFSYNLNIEPEKGNLVTDPILTIISDENSPWYMNIVSAVFYIPVNNPDSPSTEINNIMEKYFDTDQVTFAAFGVYTLVSEQIQTATRRIMIYMVLLVILAIIAAFVLFQNVLNFFDQFKQRLAVQYCLGFRVIDKYKELVCLNLISSLIELIVCMVIKLSFRTLLFWLIITVAESVVLLFSIIINEKRKILSVLKGG